MTSERLVSVSWYASEAESQAEQAKLREAGIEPSVHAEYGKPDEPVEILVPESQLEAARALLGVPPEGEGESPPDADAGPAGDASAEPRVRLCPECGSPDTGEVPSYTGRAVLGCVVVIGVGFALGRPWIAAVAIALALFAIVFLGAHAGKWRCRRCGWEFSPENARMRP